MSITDEARSWAAEQDAKFIRSLGKTIVINVDADSLRSQFDRIDEAHQSEVDKLKAELKYMTELRDSATKDMEEAQKECDNPYLLIAKETPLSEADVRAAIGARLMHMDEHKSAKEEVELLEKRIRDRNKEISSKEGLIKNLRENVAAQKEQLKHRKFENKELKQRLENSVELPDGWMEAERVSTKHEAGGPFNLLGIRVKNGTAIGAYYLADKEVKWDLFEVLSISEPDSIEKINTDAEMLAFEYCEEHNITVNESEAHSLEVEAAYHMMAHLIDRALALRICGQDD